jgi:hypothetical protein
VGKRHRRRSGVVLRFLGYDPDWFTRTLGLLLIVAGCETGWGGELYLRGLWLFSAWLVGFVLLWLGFLLVIEPGSGKPGRHRHSQR